MEPYSSITNRLRWLSEQIVECRKEYALYNSLKSESSTPDLYGEVLESTVEVAEKYKNEVQEVLNGQY